MDKFMKDMSMKQEFLIEDLLHKIEVGWEWKGPRVRSQP